MSRSEKENCVHQLIERFADTNPEKIAILDDGGNTLTYSELNQRANHVAWQLRNGGIRPGDLVSICVSRSVKMAVGILGILKAGAAYAPLDHNYPADRLEYMVEDSGAVALVSDPEHLETIKLPTGKSFILENSPTISDTERLNLDVEIDTSSPAYVIYTSGTTGKPKGVIVSHSNLFNYVSTLPEAIGLESSDRYLHTASISFSSSVRQLMLPLTNGATVVISSADTLRSYKAVFDLAIKQRVTVLDLVPSYWRVLVDGFDELTRSKKDEVIGSDLRLLLSASEPLASAVAMDVLARFGSKARLVNMFGQTETTGIISTYHVPAAAFLSNPTVSIGRAIPNAKAYILDENMIPVPDGDEGDLYVGGPGVATGYLNQPELTAERFIPDPFAGDTKSTLYRTGDLARKGEDGSLVFVGRRDNQVKIRGFRVELAEIESQLLSFPDISAAVVVAREIGVGDQRLVAYLVSKSLSQIMPAELRGSLREKLPEYMIPFAFVQLAEMPLTPNGKVDRKALPEPEAEFSAVIEPPRTETERTLVEIWKDVLKIGEVGIRDNFFDIGGHSILAITMFAKVEDTFRKTIPLATLFEAGTIERLAEILEQDGWMEQESSIVPIKPDGNRVPFFCMHAVGGNVMFYSSLGKYLHPDQPFYGLQARRLAGRQIGHATIEEMAEYYIDEICEKYPDGPFYLGGSSFGGLIAYEMARQLTERGKEVALLALLDTSTPEYKAKLTPGTTKLSIRLNKTQQRVQLHVDNLKSRDTLDKLRYLISKAGKGFTSYRRKARNAYKQSIRKLYTNIKGAGAIPRSYIQLEDQLVRARKRFVPKPFHGKAILFRASVQPFGIEHDPLLGWDTYLDEIEVHEVHGHHTSIVVEPYVGGLAKELNVYLDRLHEERIRDSQVGKTSELRSNGNAVTA